MLRIKGNSPPEAPPEEPVAPPVQASIPTTEAAPFAPPPAEDQGSMGPAKLDPMIVVYKSPDMGPFMCGNCHFFDGTSGCAIVAGTINPQGICNVFTPADLGDPEADNVAPTDGADQAEGEPAASPEELPVGPEQAG